MSGESAMVKINGKTFYCACGCNVFTKRPNDHYICNACQTEYESDQSKPELPAPTADDTEQIDDQVQDVLTVLITHGVHDYYGIPDVSQQMIDEIIANFRKDLASLGIRLTYDTPIGGE